MIIPIGRDVGLVKFPWITSLLILATTVVFFNTWPAEKKFMSVRWTNSPLVVEAKRLSDIALERGTTLPMDLRDRLEDLRAHPHFPDAEADRLLESIQKTFVYLPTLRRPGWDRHWPDYVLARQQAKVEGVPWQSVFAPWAFRSGGPLWPTVLTHLFLHAGFLHLFFNMLFLWTVGCNIEERWGPLIFLLLYFAGGLMAALVQGQAMGPSEVPMVGASGAVAAMMGAFMVRHYNARLRFFYMLGITYGRFSAPAWAVLPLWFAGEVYMGTLTNHILEGGTAHWAHVGGFAFGVLAGLVVNRGGMASSWEKEAEREPLSLDRRVEEAVQLIAAGDAAGAEAVLKTVLEYSPRHVGGLRALLAVHEALKREEEGGRTAVQLIRAALESGQGRIAEETFRLWSLRLLQISLTAQERLLLAQNLETLQLYREALAYYRSVDEKFKGSPFAGKALFSSAKILKDSLRRPEEAATILRSLLDPPYDVEWAPLAEAELKKMGK